MEVVASIREKAGRYEVRVWIKGRALSKTFSTFRQGKAWALGLEAGSIQSEPDVSNPTTPRPVPALSSASMSLVEAAEQYHADTVGQKKGARQEAERIRLLERYEWARKPFDEITSDDLRAYRNERLAQGRSGSTVRLMLSMLSAVYEHAASEWGYQGPNPARGVKMPKPAAARYRRLVHDEEARLFHALDQCKNPFIKWTVILAIETGMRRSELLSLRWQDLNLQRSVAFLPDSKNGRPRWVPFSKRALDVVKVIQQRGSFEPHAKVLPISASLLTQAWARALRRAQIDDLRFHDLRREALSRWAHRLGGDVFKLAMISGHRTLQMAQRYVVPTQSELLSLIE